MQDACLTLDTLDITFLLIALVSLVINILQWMDRRSIRAPLSNALRALFQDIKTKENNAYFVYSTIFSPNNPHTDIQTLKWEYGLFAQAVLGCFQGFKESLVGVLVSLNPEDKDGAQVTRASDYGLTDYEKTVREEYLQNLRERAQQAAKAAAAPGPETTSDRDQGNE